MEIRQPLHGWIRHHYRDTNEPCSDVFNRELLAETFFNDRSECETVAMGLNDFEVHGAAIIDVGVVSFCKMSEDSLCRFFCHRGCKLSGAGGGGHVWLTTESFPDDPKSSRPIRAP
jgi:hypothetical protein